MPDNPTPAERAVADAIAPHIRHDHDSDGSPIQEWPWWKRDEVVRDVVAAVQPVLAAEALRWVAASPDRWSGYCCHDHMAEVVLQAADEVEAGVDAVDPDAAAAVLDERRRAAQAAALRDFADAIHHPDGQSTVTWQYVATLARSHANEQERGDTDAAS